MTFNQKSLLVFSIICILILFVYSIYVNFYRIGSHDINITQNVFYSNVSQHGNYSVDIELFTLLEDNSVKFIKGIVRAEPESEFYPFSDELRVSTGPEGTWAREAGRVVFWQRVQLEREKSVRFADTGDVKYLVDIVWVDAETVSINGIVLNIYRGMYDFRRDFRRWWR